MKKFDTFLNSFKKFNKNDAIEMIKRDIEELNMFSSFHVRQIEYDDDMIYDKLKWSKNWNSKKISIYIQRIGDEYLFSMDFDKPPIQNRNFQFRFFDLDDCLNFLKECGLKCKDIIDFERPGERIITEEDPFGEEIWN